MSGGSSRRSAIGDGYHRTLWPSEHADAWRSHAAKSGGLPSDFAARGLAVSATDLALPTWGYTRNRNEVFVIGGSPQLLDVFTQAIVRSGPPTPSDLVRSLRADQPPIAAYVAKLGPLTLAKQITALTEGSTVNYTGGLVMHRNGSVYAVAQSVLYRIDPRTMKVVSRLALPLLGRLTRRWEREGYKVSASPAIVADRSHLYLDDYRDGVDNFVALDLRTGRELARLPLPATLPTVGTIFPGLNDDVYVLSSEAGAPTGKFSRIHLR